LLIAVDLLHESVAQRLNQILCHGFRELARILLDKSGKICDIVPLGKSLAKKILSPEVSFKICPLPSIIAKPPAAEPFKPASRLLSKYERRKSK
jgi:hypothetical protein